MKNTSDLNKSSLRYRGDQKPYWNTQRTESRGTKQTDLLGGLVFKANERILATVASRELLFRKIYLYFDRSIRVIEKWW